MHIELAYKSFLCFDLPSQLRQVDYYATMLEDGRGSGRAMSASSKLRKDGDGQL